MGLDTHDMVLNDGHLLKNWYHPWHCGPQLRHMGAPYEQCRDRPNRISVFLERDVNVNCKARLSILAGISYEL